MLIALDETVINVVNNEMLICVFKVDRPPYN